MLLQTLLFLYLEISLLFSMSADRFFYGTPEAKNASSYRCEHSSIKNNYNPLTVRRKLADMHE